MKRWVTVFRYKGREIKTLTLAEVGDVKGYRIDDRPEIYKTAGEAVAVIDAKGGQKQ